jgi:putative oxidoreductase
MTTTDEPEASAEPHPRFVSPMVTGALTLIGLVGAVYAATTAAGTALPLQAKIFMLLWLAFSTAVTFLVTPRRFVAGFLIGLMAMLIGWRVAALHSVAVVTWPLLAAFGAFVLQFFDCLRADRGRAPTPFMSASNWHLTFIRIYIGFDLVPHCTEKLFAGSGPRLDDVKAFADMGLPYPEFFVILGGFCEIGIVIGIGLGLLTRLAAPCAALYYLIATLIGGHFLNGFIWANPGGGWEYPVLMMVLFLSFMPRGAGPFSMDGVLVRSGAMPRALRILAAGSRRPETWVTALSPMSPGRTS